MYFIINRSILQEFLSHEFISLIRYPAIRSRGWNLFICSDDVGDVLREIKKYQSDWVDDSNRPEFRLFGELQIDNEVIANQ